MAKPSAAPVPIHEASTARSLVSLALCIHLFCVAVVLSSNFRRSRLQTELVSLFGVYTQLLHFDPDFTPYYYTFGRPLDDDTTFSLDLYADADRPVAGQTPLATVQLPAGGTAWLEDRNRYFRLARLLSASADPETENDDVTSEIARSVGGRVMRERGAKRAVFRAVRRLSQPLDLALLNPGFPANRPTDPAYDQVIYEADVWIDEDGVQAQKRASRAEVAPRQTGPSAPAGGSATPVPPRP